VQQDGTITSTSERQLEAGPTPDVGDHTIVAG
jgi:hypothetical protein